MTIVVKVTRLGDDVAVVLPAEVRSRLNIGEGDSLVLTEFPSGVALTAQELSVDEQVELGKRFMDEFEQTFRELAR